MRPVQVSVTVLSWLSMKRPFEGTSCGAGILCAPEGTVAGDRHPLLVSFH
jgi:hypothetical protein